MKGKEAGSMLEKLYFECSFSSNLFVYLMQEEKAEENWKILLENSANVDNNLHI